jgi:hypothetical protein
MYRKKFETKSKLNKGYQKMEGFRELHNNMVPQKHDSQNNTPLNITPLMHVSDSFYIECPPAPPPPQAYLSCEAWYKKFPNAYGY